MPFDGVIRIYTIQLERQTMAGQVKSTSRPTDTMRELKHRKALRLGFEMCQEIPTSSLPEYPSMAEVRRDRRVTLDGAKGIGRTNVKTTDADEHDKQGPPQQATGDTSPNQKLSSSKVVRKCRSALRRQTSQTPSTSLLQCSKEETSLIHHNAPQRTRQNNSSPESFVGHCRPISRACSRQGLTFSLADPQESKPEAIPCSKGNKGVVTSLFDTSSELTVTPPQSLPLKELQGQTVPADSQDHDEETEEDLPRFCMQMEERALTKGVCVWCKVRGFPYWPAMVNCLYRKEKKAGVVFIDEFIFQKRRTLNGIKVTLRNLKPFDAEETAELVDKARDRYGTAIDHCLELIRDYKIRIGCGSFSGSLVEYITDDISIPLRRLYLSSPNKNILKDHKSPVEHQNISSPCTQDVHSPDQEVHSPDQEVHSPDQEVHSPDQEVHAPDQAVHPPDQEVHAPDQAVHPPDPELNSCKAAHNCNNEKMVHFIVRERGLEGHLQGVISGSVLSKWLQAYKRRSRKVVKTYIEDDEQLDQIFYYLKDVLEKASPCLSELEKIHFILDVLLPEAVIHGISVVEGISVKKAEDKYMQWPFVSERERKEFDFMIAKQMKKWHNIDNNNL
ncbi:PWWP domain-containing DNA repair factor 3B-like isoform X2 [Hypomesus transpacificus]|uniref:PWWP domain-containing DNA repair factor 3B-like isoform X2 n=1 Tax=Hypomesus transpacificus TaxID=137520 RepID=UPI001F0717F0|nr:PWWP domain-containing DNA repair factor 3B-like isoform X2 [Hypomesus transpacificus]